MWRKLRIWILLFILATVGHRAWLETHDLAWDHSLDVTVYPINADKSDDVSAYIAHISVDQFLEVSEYLSEEAARYDLKLASPFQIRLGPTIENRPPQPPLNAAAVESIIWSLQFRWWTWRNSPPVSINPDIKLYLLYHDPALHHVLPHSTALSKGRVGLVNVFAAEGQQKQNAIVITHELLHTVGATDKYDLKTNQPYFPDGYAESDKQPTFPQDYAELMAGRIPVSAHQSEIPRSLAYTLIGELTAAELGWLRNQED